MSNDICQVVLPSSLASERFAQILSGFLTAPLVIGFSGEIGMGKTTIIRALFAHMGINTRIKSPTFSLVESYYLESNLTSNLGSASSKHSTLGITPSGGNEDKLTKQPTVLHHFDLYRVQDESELDYIGFRDYFADNAICCIEWPEKLGGYKLDLDIIFKLERHENGRKLSFDAQSLFDLGLRRL